jgi:phospholipase/lecithinase/hemolysin
VRSSVSNFFKGITMKLKLHLAAITAAVLLAACGGGGTDTTAVKVVGDSLADGGTFGFKFTVQGTTSEPLLIWTDRVAGAVGAPSLCARYMATSATTVTLNPNATACTSYGVGGGRINPVGTAGDSSPFSIVQQLKDVAASGNFGGEELLLADGGGNDVADLLGAYLAASRDGGASYTALLGELLTPAQVGAAAQAGSAGLAQAGGQYMVALANAFADALNAHALDKGAQRIAIVNAPDVTKTPRFQAVLAGVALASGGGSTGQSAAAQVGALADGWVKAFNAQVSSRFATNGKVVVVDFYSELNKWLASPSAYGLTNTTTPACPATGTDSTGLPQYTLATCTAAGLSAAPQPGTSGADWWKTYAFSDNFHGTPRTNQLMADVVLTALTTKGWK